ncbi:MAG: hypothetical protein WC807_21095 [Hyphomicrobium sp.]|jgi:hypothetical protein
MGGVDWWAPEKSGNADADFLAGGEHFQAVLSLLAGIRDPEGIDFCSGLIVPPVSHPAEILGTILGGMRQFGPMEYGFIEALVDKAIAGRLPPVCNLNDARWPADYRVGEAKVCAALTLARIARQPDEIIDELIEAIGKKFECVEAVAFIWAVCVAATSGALH